MTFWETIERGEYVMIALAVALIFIVILWTVRASKLYREQRGYGMLMQRLRDLVVEGDLENARQLCRMSGTPGGRMLAAGVGSIGKPIADVRNAMSSHEEAEKYAMTKGVIWLRIFAVICPLLGLGGTLVGIIDRLRDLGEAGAIVDTSAVCAAIAPTIVSTVAGIGVGICSLIALAFLTGSIRKSSRSLDRLALDFDSLLNEPS